MTDQITKGSCNCGEFQYQYTGEPLRVAMCHCKPCQKTAGSNGSVNIIVPNDAFKVLSGKTEAFTRPGDSGKNIHCNFCVKCHTYMTADAEALEGMKIIKAGTVDGNGLGIAPSDEIYVKNRPDWCDSREGRAESAGAA